PGEYDDTACYQITQAPTCENDLVGQLQIVDDCRDIDEGDRNEGDDAGPESDASDFLDFIVKPLRANPNRQYGGRWVMRYNKVVQDAWSPQRCIDAAVNVTSNTCPGSVSCSEPPDALGCAELNGVRVCEGDPLFALLPDAPIPGVHKLCREVSVAADCRQYGGTLCVLNHEGVEVCTDITGLAPGEERNECEAYENDASCKRTSTDCLELSDGRQDCNWRTEVWDCGFDIEPTVVSTQTICDGEIRCMGESCISQQHEVNTGFAEAAATMHAVEFTGRDMSCPGRQPSLEEIIATGQLPATEQPTEQNPQGGSAECELKVFEGEHHTCKKALSGYVNCCEQPVEASIEGFIFEMAGNAGTMLNLIMITYTVYLVLDALARLIYACELKEVQLEAKRDLKSCTYVGSYCAEDTLFGCIEKHESYCCYNSPLARIVAEQTKGVEGAYDDEEDPDCSGFTPEELAELNWEEIDLSEWVAILVDSGAIPSGAEAVDYDYSPVVDAVGQQDDQPGGLEGAYESINQDLWRQQQQ
ncbi:MAG: conjugal transfer protein TraN, partial [Gammaproteobacteria bacterium]